MGHWNYRLIKQWDTWGPIYKLCEIYYDDDGQPNGYSSSSPPLGETFPEAHKDYLKMSEAFDHEAFVIVDGKLELETYDCGLDHNGNIGM